MFWVVLNWVCCYGLFASRLRLEFACCAWWKFGFCLLCFECFTVFSWGWILRGWCFNCRFAGLTLCDFEVGSVWVCELFVYLLCLFVLDLL